MLSRVDECSIFVQCSCESSEMAYITMICCISNHMQVQMLRGISRHVVLLDFIVYLLGQLIYANDSQTVSCTRCGT